MKKLIKTYNGNVLNIAYGSFSFHSYIFHAIIDEKKSQFMVIEFHARANFFFIDRESHFVKEQQIKWNFLISKSTVFFLSFHTKHWQPL
jgi:hypothetical protein